MFYRRLFQLDGKRQIYRVFISHTARSLAFSVVGIYIPIYFLTRGYTLNEVIGYYALLHVTGLLLALTIIPYLIQRYGLIATFKLNYLFEIIHLTLLFTLPIFSTPIYAIAIFSGAATFFYWVPLNILIIKNADFDKMGTDLAKFFALPKFFGIFGPLIGAGLVYFIGFWPAFLIAMVGVLFSFLPLMGINTSEINVQFHFQKALNGLRRRKKLFLFEAVDNIIEESEWFWGIYIFLIIGSLAVPGIAGSLAAIGAALFTLFIGKKVNRSPRNIVIFSAIGLAIVSLGQLLSTSTLDAYVISLVSAFVLSAFLVSYSSIIYREVKGDDEEEFIILREIPTVLGRMVVFLGILLVASRPQYFFLLPLVMSIILAISFSIRGKFKIDLQHS